jgi:hypothetical protein
MLPSPKQRESLEEVQRFGLDKQQEKGVMEYWSTGVMMDLTSNPILHHSITPLLQRFP